MARTVIVGAGFSGQYAALILQDALKGKGNHEITVINPHPRFTYIPSMIWVGIGQIEPDMAQFELAPVYDRLGIKFIRGMAKEVHPDENYLLVETAGNGASEQLRVDYDFLINATGPRLNFDATPGKRDQSMGYAAGVIQSSADCARNTAWRSMKGTSGNEHDRAVSVCITPTA